jgi:hypothetical protein
LRCAITRANADHGPVEIDFKLPMGTTIALTQGQLELSGTGGPVKIVGSGVSGLTVDACGKSRVLQIDPGVTASITGMTLSCGWVGYDSFGGGISVDGALAATGLQLLNNRAVDGGGIANSGTLNLDRSTLVGNTASHNGVGLLNNGTATLTRVGQLANSASSDGGGVFDDGVAVLTDSTVRGNTAADGGGLYVAAEGTITLARTKVKGNRGGDIAGAGSVS